METLESIVIGSRASQLALAQAAAVEEMIGEYYPETNVKIKEIITKGDQIVDKPFHEIDGKGLFLKELEKELLVGGIDLAVHSLKDVPTELPEGLELLGPTLRADARDVFVSLEYESVSELPEGAIVGTSSLRRTSQLLGFRPDLVVKPIRGNVNTRLKKLAEEDYDGIVLAAAGLERLGLDARITDYFSPRSFLPAAGQGALAIEIASDNEMVRAFLSKLINSDLENELTAERTLLKVLGGGCQVPVGAYARVIDDQLTLYGMVGSLDGSQIVRDQVTGRPDFASQLARDLAGKLKAAGASEILKEVRNDAE
ncbi:MAG: hydroxymethylbilane synthase [Halarsenatibacteraceae bacterium]